MEWQLRKTTTPHKETQHANQSQNNKENTVGDDEGQVRLLIGAMLTLASYTAQFATSLERVALSNLVTPRTAEALSYALWEMVNLTTSILDRLKTYRYTLAPSSKTSLSEEQFEPVINDVEKLLRTITEDFDL